MKYTIPVFALTALFLFGCGDSEKKPATKDYEKQFAVEVPAYLELSSFDVEASENVGSKVEPMFKARFKATVKLKTKTFELANQENEATFIHPIADEGETKDIYGMAAARLSAGNWKIDFSLENNPIPALGHPKDFFTGRRVIVVGTAEESEFKAQQDQKRLVAEQEAEKALKAQQLEEGRRKIALEAERKVAEKAAEEAFKARQLEEGRRRIALEAERKVAEKAAEEKRLKREQELEEFNRANPTRLVGKWHWASSSDRYSAIITITSHTHDGDFSGQFPNGESTFHGTLIGDRIEFTRILLTLGNAEQRFSARLVGTRPNLKMVDGTWSGAYASEGTDFHCEMIP